MNHLKSKRCGRCLQKCRTYEFNQDYFRKPSVEERSLLDKAREALLNAWLSGDFNVQIEAQQILQQMIEQLRK